MSLSDGIDWSLNAWKLFIIYEAQIGGKFWYKSIRFFKIKNLNLKCNGCWKLKTFSCRCLSEIPLSRNFNYNSKSAITMSCSEHFISWISLIMKETLKTTFYRVKSTSLPVIILHCSPLLLQDRMEFLQLWIHCWNVRKVITFHSSS